MMPQTRQPKKLNGRDIKGRPIRVNEAQARSGNDRPSGAPEAGWR